jgi:hypothetical protein
MLFLNLPSETLRIWVTRLEEQRILVRERRWVTHLDVSAEDVDRVCTAIRSLPA